MDMSDIYVSISNEIYIYIQQYYNKQLVQLLRRPPSNLKIFDELPYPLVIFKTNSNITKIEENKENRLITQLLPFHQYLLPKSQTNHQNNDMKIFSHYSTVLIPSQSDINFEKFVIDDYIQHENSNQQIDTKNIKNTTSLNSVSKDVLNTSENIFNLSRSYINDNHCESSSYCGSNNNNRSFLSYLLKSCENDSDLHYYFFWLVRSAAVSSWEACGGSSRDKSNNSISDSSSYKEISAYNNDNNSNNGNSNKSSQKQNEKNKKNERNDLYYLVEALIVCAMRLIDRGEREEKNEIEGRGGSEEKGGKERKQGVGRGKGNIMQEMRYKNDMSPAGGEEKEGRNTGVEMAENDKNKDLSDQLLLLFTPLLVAINLHDDLNCLWLIALHYCHEKEAYGNDSYEINGTNENNSDMNIPVGEDSMNIDDRDQHSRNVNRNISMNIYDRGINTDENMDKTIISNGDVDLDSLNFKNIVLELNLSIPTDINIDYNNDIGSSNRDSGDDDNDDKEERYPSKSNIVIEVSEGNFYLLFVNWLLSPESIYQFVLIIFMY